MGTRQQPVGDEHNSAIAVLFRCRKAEIGARMTFQVLADLTGLNLRQLKRLLNDERAMHMSEYVLIVSALGLDPGDALTDALARAKKAAGAALPDV